MEDEKLFLVFEFMKMDLKEYLDKLKRKFTFFGIPFETSNRICVGFA